MSETSMSLRDTCPLFEMEKYLTPIGCLYVEDKSEVTRDDKTSKDKQKNLSK